MMTWSRKTHSLGGFSQRTGDWSHLLVAPQETVGEPVVAGNVGAVRVAGMVAAFSGTTGTWDVLRTRSLLKNVPSIEVALNDLVKVKVGELLYTFAAASGKWTSPNGSAFRTSTVLPMNRLQPYPASAVHTFDVLWPGINRNAPFDRPGVSRFDQEALRLARRY